VTGTSAIDHPPVGVGILGGTFNPPHLGHLAVARHALSELALERVILMPAGRPPHKQGELGPGGEHRLAMCEAMIDGSGSLSSCRLELEREGTSYTVDTLRAIHSSNPDVKLTFIVGADTARTLTSWREPAQLLELADIAIAEREDTERDELLKTLAPLRAESQFRFLRMGTIDVSSSQIRTLLAEGAPVGDLVGGAVEAYITEHGLYQPGTVKDSR
jgi:nicotinate-nucleotide adenylyltransferase